MYYFYDDIHTQPLYFCTRIKSIMFTQTIRDVQTLLTSTSNGEVLGQT